MFSVIPGKSEKTDKDGNSDSSDSEMEIDMDVSIDITKVGLAQVTINNLHIYYAIIDLI